VARLRATAPAFDASRVLTEFRRDQAFENTSTSVAASRMRNAFNNLTDSVTDENEKARFETEMDNLGIASVSVRDFSIGIPRLPSEQRYVSAGGNTPLHQRGIMEDFNLPKEAVEEGFSIKKDELFAQLEAKEQMEHYAKVYQARKSSSEETRARKSRGLRPAQGGHGGGVQHQEGRVVCSAEHHISISSIVP
jgi:hypothetical protein